MITKIQDYYLGQRIKDTKDLIEYTDEEYHLFEAAGARRMLKNERIYNGRIVNFAGFNWDTVIGATEGKIYKIAIQIFGDDKDHIDIVFKLTCEYITNAIGEYPEHTLLSNSYIWDSSDGNIHLNKVSERGYHGVNIILTSSLTKSQLL